jgi:hypothetical protein
MVVGIVGLIGTLTAFLRVGAEHYNAVLSSAHVPEVRMALPKWSKPFSVVANFWIWGNMFWIFTNPKRKELRDMLAGTVVVLKNPKKTVQTVLAAI